MKRAIRLFAILTVLVAAVTAASAGPATADPPPDYFVDESKLPFPWPSRRRPPEHIGTDPATGKV